MKITPSVMVTRFAQLSSGDLFMFEHGDGACVGMVVEDPTRDGDKLYLPLGPNLPPHMSWPTLLSSRAFTTISLGNDFVVRLPAGPHGWADTEPAPDVRAILVADNRVYFRANFGHDGQDSSLYRACFVEFGTGLICASGNGHHAQYSRPVGVSAFAVEWEIATSEDEPRIILAYNKLGNA